MNEITKNISKLQISPEMLASINVNGILDEFREDYRKLGEFKRARETHENRNAISRWWNSDELENAQLDSIELQESFSQKLGQLMVISVAMSQQLNEQQCTLGEQQDSLKRQTEDIAIANTTISEQQQLLSKQQIKLENLINDYFALKGLTADNAKQLIAIAEYIKTTKERLINTFTQERNSILAMKNEIEKVIAQQHDKFRLLSERQNQRMAECLNEVNHSLVEIQKRANQQLEQTIKTATELTSSTHQQLKDTLIDVSNQLAKQWLEVDAALLQQREEIEIRGIKMEKSIQQQSTRMDNAEQALSRKILQLKRLTIANLTAVSISLAWLIWMQISI